MAELSAQRVRSKVRAAVRRREDAIETEEMESGELNLIPYLDMVTNLMLFMLASVSTLILAQIDTTIPDRADAPPTDQVQPATNPNDQPLKMAVVATGDHVEIWSFSGLEGTSSAPKKTFLRTGHIGDTCDGAYMCETNMCDAATAKCIPSKDPIAPVFDYRGISDVLFEIANRRYAGRPRKADTYQGILMADVSTPYSTLVSLMAAMRCHLPPLGKSADPCLLPSADPELKKAANPIAGKVYDTERAVYDPNKMALFHDILFASGFRSGT